MPVGTAVGFILSAIISARFSWYYCFLGLSILSMIPVLIVCLFSFSPASSGLSPLSHLNSNGCEARHPGSYNGSRSLKKLLNNPAFLGLLISGAAQAAISAGLTCFGTAYLINLDFIQSEIMASLVLGLIGTSIGALGTFSGGLLLEFVTGVQVDAFQEPLVVKSDDTQRKIKQKQVLRLILALAFPASILLSLSPLLVSRFHISNIRFQLYTKINALIPLFILAFGLLLIFLTQSGLNLSVMLSGPPELRSLAISVYTLGLHLLGDVPGPILIGYARDNLAPNCVGSFSVECKHERNALLLTLFGFLSWGHMIWLGILTSLLLTS